MNIIRKRTDDEELQLLGSKILELHNKVFPDYFRDRFNELYRDEKKCWWVLLVDQEELIGMGSVSLKTRDNFSTWFMTNVGIHPDHRRRGYGRLIVKEIIQIAGNMILTGKVEKDNEGAIELYKSLGMEIRNTKGGLYDIVYDPLWQ